MRIDATRGALEEARKIAANLGIEGNMGFIECDFLNCAPGHKFDVIFAVGCFDYIFDPVTYLKRMMDLSDGIIHASFPKRWRVLSGIRKIRLTLNRCPVRFYTKKDIKGILRECSVDRYELRSIFRDNILIVRK